ncbi:rhomboid family intramembrane serine protease [Vannielia sp.]|uniref:rhomboid family intramembrane serine protease n=1 Tax=Vannielia sp. TaxID=2813045 RepID=UPI00260B46A0|nr:rhomboid family intramembrane serine protease [Vannielia sp.]MDF1872728.1 rhomboid family intramembrane serine protease [Vannielia sp.]
MSTDHNVSPFNTVPAAIVALVVVIAGAELVFSLAQMGLIGRYQGGDDLRMMALQTYAFSGEIFDMMLERGEFPPSQLLRFVSYGFVHISFTQMIFGAVLTLALGKMVAETFGQVQALVLFFGGLICGALAYALLLNDSVPLFGAFPGAYALIGAYTYILWVHYGHLGENQYRAFTLIGGLCVFHLVFGVVFGASNLWVAELGGFAAGMFLSVPLSPGGWARLMQRMRQR